MSRFWRILFKKAFGANLNYTFKNVSHQTVLERWATLPDARHNQPYLVRLYNSVKNSYEDWKLDSMLNWHFTSRLPEVGMQFSHNLLFVPFSKRNYVLGQVKSLWNRTLFSISFFFLLFLTYRPEHDRGDEHEFGLGQAYSFHERSKTSMMTLAVVVHGP